MNRIRSTKATNTGRLVTSAGASPQLMTVVPPQDHDLSEPNRQWQQENRAAFDCYNDWIAEHGLPLEEYRQF